MKSILLVVASCLVTGISSFAAPKREPTKGIVVLLVEKNWEGDTAGIKSGDTLLYWENRREKREFQSPFDLSPLEVEQSPRGTVRLHGLHNGKRRVWALGQDRWGIIARPVMKEPLDLLYQRGELLAHSGKTSEAASAWTEAALQAGPSAAWVLFHAAEAFARLQTWELADNFYQKAVQQASDAGGTLSSELLNAWSESLRKRGQFKAARTHYQELLEEGQKVSSSPLKIALILNGLGNVTASLGGLVQAEKYYLQSLAIRRQEAPGSMAVASSLSNLGLLEWQRGNFVRAEAYYKDALRIAQRWCPHGQVAAIVFNNLGALNFNRGDLSEAEEYYEHALRIHQRFDRQGYAIAPLLNNIGMVALQKGNLRRAEKYILRSMAISAKLAPESLGTARSLNNLSHIAHQQGRVEVAEHYLRQALDIENKMGDSAFAYLTTVNNLADILGERNQLNEAEQYYRLAIEATRNMAPEIADGSEPLAGLASVLVRKQQLEAAAQAFEESISNLETQAAHLGGTENVRAGFRANRVSHYLDYIDLLIAQGKPEQALQVLERSRSRTLLEMLEESHINIRATVSAHLLQQEQVLHQNLDDKIHRQLQILSSHHTAEHLASIKSEVEELLRQYQQLEAEIRISSPVYASLTQPRILSTKEIQTQILDSDTVLLEYSLGPSHSYVWVITQTAVECHELPRREEIDAVARQYYRLVNSRGRQARSTASGERKPRPIKTEHSLLQTEATLSRIVLGPVSGQLNHTRILIVSDEILQYIPFAALPVPESENGGRLEQLPLVARHELVMLPSASVLAVLRSTNQHKQSSRTVAVLADPVFDKNDARINRRHRNISGKASSLPLGPSESIFVTQRLLRSATETGLSFSGVLYFPRLVFTRKEARSILASVPPGEAMAALDFNASRALATSQELARYRIVHFATHGLLNSKHPELSGLVFSLVDKTGKAQNGFLQLEDIYNLKLPVELVVLSACETGLGREIHKEGLLGLTRGFMYAGASRVIASLWKVDDIATAQLMGYFYQAMEREKLPAAAALRRAQVEMWRQKRWKHPYYWAGFQIQGEWK